MAGKSLLGEFLEYAEEVERAESSSSSGDSRDILELMAIAPMLKCLEGGNVNAAVDMFHARRDIVGVVLSRLPAGKPDQAGTNAVQKLAQHVEDLRRKAEEIPRVFREHRDAFSRSRSDFYAVRGQWDSMVRRVLDMELPSKIDIVEGKLQTSAQHGDPRGMVNELQALHRTAADARDQLGALEREMGGHVSVCQKRMDACRQASEAAMDVLARVGRLREACALLDLPISPEMDRTLKTCEHIFGDDDGDRVPELSLSIPPRPVVLNDLFESLLERQVFLLPHLGDQLLKLFKPEAGVGGRPSVARGMLALVAFAQFAEKEKGRSIKSVAGWIRHSGLSNLSDIEHEALIDDLESTLQLLELIPRRMGGKPRTITARVAPAFVIERFRFGYVWTPSDETRAHGERLAALLEDRELVLEALRRGRTKFGAEMKEKRATESE